MAFSPDGKQVVSGSRDRMVRLWDAATGAALRTLEGHTDYVWSVAFSPDGKLVASGTGEVYVKLSPTPEDYAREVHAYEHAARFAPHETSRSSSATATTRSAIGCGTPSAAPTA